MKMPPKVTPWGEWNYIREIIPGVFRVSTASHGGYWLNEERRAQMPAVLVEGPPDGAEKPFSVTDTRNGWYEEDLEAFRVVLVFAIGNDAAAFPGSAADLHKRATEYLEREYPNTVKALRASGFFDRGRPQNPPLPMAGTVQ